MPGSPSHRHLAEGSLPWAPHLTTLTYAYCLLSLSPASLICLGWPLAQGTGKNLLVIFHNTIISLSLSVPSCSQNLPELLYAIPCLLLATSLCQHVGAKTMQLHSSTCSISSLWLSGNIDAYLMTGMLSARSPLMLLTLKYALLLLCFIQMSKTSQRG